jgi:DNA-binding beta-propeller fold protein YncE
VSCPEGLAVTPDSEWLFVASQCGGGKDPVFVIDTADDSVTKAISNLAVGIALAITPDGKKVYVVRGSFKQPGQAGTPTKSYPPQLSVIETARNRIVETLPFPYGIGAIAVTRDSRHLLVGRGTQIVILDTTTDKEVDTMSVGLPITAIAISGNNTAYARRGQKGDLFVARLSGLLKTEEHEI